MNYEKFNKTETDFQSIISKRNKTLYERFIPEKFANTGEDPTGKILEFTKKDFIKQIKKPEIYHTEKPELKTRENRWALNTTKICTSPKNLPKLQKLKNYNFITRNKEEAEKYQKSFFKTDNISMKVPKENFQKAVFSFSEAKRI